MRLRLPLAIIAGILVTPACIKTNSNSLQESYIDKLCTHHHWYVVSTRQLENTLGGHVSDSLGKQAYYEVTSDSVVTVTRVNDYLVSTPFFSRPLKYSSTDNNTHTIYFTASNLDTAATLRYNFITDSATFYSSYLTGSEYGMDDPYSVSEKAISAN